MKNINRADVLTIERLRNLLPDGMGIDFSLIRLNVEMEPVGALTNYMVRIYKMYAVATYLKCLFRQWPT